MNRTEIIEQLKNGPMIVTFEKKDGTIRKMKCTLKSDLLTEYEKKTDRESKPNLDNLFSGFDNKANSNYDDGIRFVIIVI